MPYFEFRQNNVHGVMKVDHVRAPFVIVEAMTAGKANCQMEALGMDFDDYCPCCGTRWTRVIEADALQFPMDWSDKHLHTLGDYLLALATNFPAGEPGTLHARAFFLDGNVGEYHCKPYEVPTFLNSNGQFP